MTEDQLENLRKLAHDVSKIMVDNQFDNRIQKKYKCEECGKTFSRAWCQKCRHKILTSATHNVWYKIN